MMERCEGCFTDENIIGRRRLGGIRALRFIFGFFDITIGRGLLESHLEAFLS